LVEEVENRVSIARCAVGVASHKWIDGVAEDAHPIEGRWGRRAGRRWGCQWRRG